MYHMKTFKPGGEEIMADARYTVEKCLTPGFPTAKAFKLVFTEDKVFVLFIGKDRRGFGTTGGGLLGRLVFEMMARKSDKKIARAMEAMAGRDPEELVRTLPKSCFFLYADLTEFKERKGSLLAGWPIMKLKLRNGDKHKFNFYDEAQRLAVIDLIKEKRGDLLLS